MIIVAPIISGLMPRFFKPIITNVSKVPSHPGIIVSNPTIEATIITPIT